MTPHKQPWPELRQGDICTLDLFPYWDVNKALTVSGLTGPSHLQIPGMDKVLPAKVPAGQRLVAVCSYDCDLENPRDRRGILLAPIFALSPTDPRSEGILGSDRLQTNDVGELVFNYLQLFPVSVDGLTTVPTPHGVIDFSAMTSLGKAAAVTGTLLTRKVAEMTEDQRLRFRSKLATFVGRPEKLEAA